MRKRRELNGLVVAVAGGARGIGLETVKLLAGAGANVAVGDIRLEALEQALAELPGETAGFEVDVANRASYSSFIDAAEDRFGPLDVLVNNAGVMALGPFLDEDDATADRMIDINFRGAILALKLAVPRMLARAGRGQVVVVDSASARIGVPGAATYSATKHAVYGLADALDAELRGKPIDITLILPTVVRTELTRGVKVETVGVPTLEPGDVARAIVGAIEKPRFEVYVPASLGPTYAFAAIMPRRVKRLLSRLLRADRALTEIDVSDRAQYERDAFG